MGRRRVWMVLLAVFGLLMTGSARHRATAGMPAPIRVVARTGLTSEAPLDTATVSASGRIEPLLDAQPGFSIPGRVVELAIAEGDVVETGDALVRLCTDELEADVARAEAAVAMARAELMSLRAGPRLGDVAAAEARLEAAEGALAEASARLHQLTGGAGRALRTAANAQVAAAESDAIAARIEVVQLLARKQENRKAVKDWEETAAFLRRQAAEQNLAAAQANVAQTERSTYAEIRAAQAVVSTTLAQRNVALAQLEWLRAGPTTEQIAAAEASVSQAEAALGVARVALDETVLRAPFPGTVTALQVSLGETVLPGQAALTLADLSHLRVKTTDLSERDVARVAVGQPATVYVEAMGVELSGRVEDIAARADTVGGDKVFAVFVGLDRQEPALRWGMSVEVEIGVD